MLHLHPSNRIVCTILKTAQEESETGKSELFEEVSELCLAVAFHSIWKNLHFTVFVKVVSIFKMSQTFTSKRFR